MLKYGQNNVFLKRRGEKKSTRIVTVKQHALEGAMTSSVSWTIIVRNISVHPVLWSSKDDESMVYEINVIIYWFTVKVGVQR